ncbi:hypothetical protein [Kribbella sp. CA-293567]|uniref:hypothetical protein n=1 Tax=Kribbella sp. CA-293567 TaxID=3002436 RepID=UPI0022DD4B38|nr:hypothetical protein [Kribbella sp. CA-293567]WBQ05325.1 hypothetical protein OX958_00665 [Kribbella sp. CA-293567]
MTQLPWNWQATPGEVAEEYPCDRFVTGPVVGCWRAADSTASVDQLFRWLCQLRVAPYSYDLVDNFGRSSPRTLTAEADQLERGQIFMTIFELADFTPGRHLTLNLVDPKALKLFGQVAVTYLAVPTATGSRLIVKLALPARGNAVRRTLLAWGDLLMMRKQVLELTRLAAG